MLVLQEPLPLLLLFIIIITIIITCLFPTVAWKQPKRAAWAWQLSAPTAPSPVPCAWLA